MTSTIDYNQVRAMFDKTVSDGSYTYKIADYSMGCDAYKLWCHETQKFYYTSHAGVHQLMTIISE